MTPTIEIADHSMQNHGIRLDELESMAIAALPLCLNEEIDGGVLGSLNIIEVSLLSDEGIAKIHAEFMDLPDPTDVITFHHGEILISVDTAAREAPNFGHDTQTEISLYLIHGLLHLAGYDDHEPQDYEKMKILQETILYKLAPR